ncbi:MAG: AraC family transcriptional regulator [Candidatus Accumulibacter sp.]|nr:AraC family transcriptional regulator [Accumulibacter sp.]
MKPDLEVVEVLRHESFKVWGHGYPFRTVRWHFHPEYEIQLITETTGQYFVGDFVGRFAPGNLVFMAPNLPHNWVSELPENVTIERRNLICQFSAEFLDERLMIFPEMRYLEKLIGESRRGVVFSQATGEAARPFMEEMLIAAGGRRLILFLALLDLIVHDGKRKMLASRSFLPDPSDYLSSTINRILIHIDQNLASDIGGADMADLTGQSVGAFSRYFRKHTGMSFVQYVNTMRIRRACELLIETGMSIADICYCVGYNNVSNFNRHFLKQKGVPPSRFRALYRMNKGQRTENGAARLLEPAIGDGLSGAGDKAGAASIPPSVFDHQSSEFKLPESAVFFEREPDSNFQPTT